MTTCAAWTLIAVLLTGCTTGARGVEGESTDAPTTTADSSSSTPSETSEPGEVEDPSSSDGATRGEDDDDSGAGEDESGDAPAESEARTLCNLTEEYLQGLFDRGASGEYEYLDLAALSLADSLKIWRGLVAEFPDSTEDVELAQQVYDLWQAASISLSEGDTDAADDSLVESETVIAELPSAADNDQVGCTSE